MTLEESARENKEKQQERQGTETDDGRNEVSFSSEWGFFFQGLSVILIIKSSSYTLYFFSNAIWFHIKSLLYSVPYFLCVGSTFFVLFIIFLSYIY